MKMDATTNQLNVSNRSISIKSSPIYSNTVQTVKMHKNIVNMISEIKNAKLEEDSLKGNFVVISPKKHKWITSIVRIYSK